jgi:hypothetical protein
MGLRQRSIAAVAILAVAIVATACGAGATASPQADAEKAACTAIQTWSDEMRQFEALDPTTATADDVKAQAAAVQSAWADVKSAMEAVNAADKAAFMAAGDTLEAALKDIPTDVPVADAIAGVKTAAEPLKATYAEVANGINCVLVTPY